MTGNTSATGGFLLPTSTAPAEDQALEDFIHDLIVGVTGIDATLVRPRWQPTPPKQPSANTDWCAFGVTETDADEYASRVHDPAADSGNGVDNVHRHSTVSILASFYGPNGQGNASLLRDGLQVPQNRETLYGASMGFLEASRIIVAPALINAQWVRRFDITVLLRREVVRTFAVQNVESIDDTIIPSH